MNLIWENAMSSNAETSIHYQLAKELSDCFRRKYENLPRTELELWVYRLGQAQGKLIKLLEARPEERKQTQANVTKPARPTKILLRQKSPSEVPFVVRNSFEFCPATRQKKLYRRRYFRCFHFFSFRLFAQKSFMVCSKSWSISMPE
jgi:hypothetical protein